MIRTKNLFSPFFVTASSLTFLLFLIWGLWSDQVVLAVVPVALLIVGILLQDLRRAFLLLCLAVPLSFNLEGMIQLGIDFPDEPLMLLLTICFPLFLLINYGTWSLRDGLRHPLVLLILASFLWMCITVIFSENPALSSKYLVKRIWYLVPFFVLPLLLFKDRKILIRSYQMMFGMLFVIVTLVLIRFSAKGFRFEEVHDPIQPFFINHVMYGSMISCFLPLSTGAMFLSRKLSVHWMLSIAGIVVFILGVYFSYSRAAWMGVIFAAGAVFFIRFKLMHQAMLLFYAVLLTAILWLSHNNHYLDFKPKFEKTIMHESLEDHIMATIQGTDISSAERYYRWIAAIRMSQDRPILGVGPNNFYDFYKAYTITSFRTWVSRNFERSTTHNYFLFMLVEQGYPALILYALLIWAIFFYGQRLYHRLEDRQDRIILLAVLGMLASLFINNFFSELLETDKIGSLFLIGLSVLVLLDRTSKKTTKKTMAT